MFDTQKCLKALHTQNSLNKDLATVMQYFVSAKMRTRLRKSAHCDVTNGRQHLSNDDIPSQVFLPAPLCAVQQIIIFSMKPKLYILRGDCKHRVK